MIQDAKLIFSDAQECFATNDTVASTNDLDLGVANPNQGAGSPRKTVRVKVNTAVTGGTSIQAQLVHSADDSTYTVLATGPAVLVAAAIAGKLLLETVLPKEHGRYLRVNYINVGANAAGKADAWIDIDN